MSYRRFCGAEYTTKTGEVLVCHLPQGHNVTALTEHSWEWLKTAEESDTEPPELEELIEDIAAGQYDPYLESLLAALHGRKRALRNVPNPYGRAEGER